MAESDKSRSGAEGAGATGALYARINAHPGKRILDALQGYTISKNIMAGNAFQLRHLLQVLDDPKNPAGIMCVEQRQKLQGLLNETIRHFHNFLSSIKTLVDHSRSLMGEQFVSKQHREDYERRVKATFAEDAFARFVQDCRNYITHRAVPVAVMTHELMVEPERIRLSFDLETMADWDGWTQPSRKYIAEHGPKVRILDLVDEYEQKFKGSHEQFVLDFQRYYEREINEALALMPQWNGRLGASPNAGRAKT